MKPVRILLAATAVFALALATPSVNAGCFDSASACCATEACCAPATCCCTPPPPPPVEVEWCVEDPCTGCEYRVSACVPACCEGVVPCLDDWRKGLLGRKVLTYKFPCCDHCVDVVITKRGRTIVRD